MSYVEGNRFLYLETPLGTNKLLLQSFTGSEGLSQLFDFQLELLAENQTNVNFDALIGQKVSFGIQGSDSNLGTRHFNGIVVELSQGGRDRDFTQYRMRIVPDIWRLTRKFQSRIFQHLNVPDILKQVLAGVDVDYQIQGAFEPREYCTQYRETDFNFMSRLMEEEGIYYFFKFTHGGHQLVVANTPSSHPDIPKDDPKLTFDPVRGGVRDDERITEWLKEQSWGSGKFTTWDHHFQLPHRKLQGQEMSSITVAAGKVTHKLDLAGNDALEIYDYPAAYAQRFDGINKSGGEQPDELQKISPDAKRSVGIWMQQQEMAMLLVQAVSNCRHITAGHKFTLQRHFNGDGQYTITQVSHAGEEGDFRSSQGGGTSHYSNRFECIPYALPFRPPQLAKRPLIAGPQTAVVVGPSGEEIFTDKYGRVKVQFHWDREGQYDGDSSCWLRVGTLWAGKQWGSVFLPRIGHEVIVGFIEGDPDRPVIVGSVYNADTMPPYELPANKTRSGIKSDSSMGSGGFNEIRFEDLKGKEQIFIHGQKDSDTRIENDCREWIGEDRHLIVKRDQYEEVDRDIHLKVLRNHMESIQGDRSLTVQGKDAVQITGAQSLQVTGNVAEQFGANHTEETTSSYYLQAQSIVLEAETSISLTVGSNFISISPAGVTIMGMPMVNINSGGAAIPGVPGMLVSPVAPGTAIEADQAVAGSEVTYSGGGPPDAEFKKEGGGDASPAAGSGSGSGSGSGAGAGSGSGAGDGSGTGSGSDAATGSGSDAGTGSASGPGAAGSPTPPMPVLEIVNRKTGAVVSGTTQTVIVGQKMELLVRTKPSEAMSDIQWTLPMTDPEQCVKDYTQTRSEGKKTLLAAGDLQGVNLDFYWIAGGSQTVKVAATVRGARLTAEVTHKILAPTAVSMHTTTGEVGVGDTFFDVDPPMNLYFGTRLIEGIKFRFTATAPAGGDGTISATQLVKPFRQWTANAGTAKTLTSAEYVLDTTVPYGPEVDVKAGASATWSDSDSPSNGLAAAVSKVAANDQFCVYFMYKNEDWDSIPVTLMSLSWHWAAETTRVGAPDGTDNKWNPPTGVGKDKDPSGTASTHLPEWKANVRDLKTT